MKAWPRRALRALVTGAGILLLAALLLEGLLQVASLFVDDRGGAWLAQSRVRILAVGDSHTYGAFMPRDQTFPAHLQRFLEERDPGVYSVLNRGIPGMSTAQVRNRLPVWLSRYRPDAVVVWAGINNSWNAAERDAAGGSLASRLAGLATRSRLYRLVRVWLHDRGLERVAAGSDWQVLGVEGALGDVERWRVRHDGREETIVHRRLPEDAERAAAVEEDAARDLARMVEQTRAAGAEIVMITYPYDVDWFATANRAMRRVSERYGVPLVDSSQSVMRLPPERRELTWAAHPTGDMYREIARDIVPLVPAAPR